MKQVYVWVVIFLALVIVGAVMSGKALSAELLMDMPAAGPVTIERGTTPTGPFTTIATVPQGTTRFLLTPGQWGHYRARNAAGPSNTAQYALDVYSDTVTSRLATMETSITALQQVDQELAARLAVIMESPEPTPPPAPTSNFTITQIDADHVRLVCNGIGITTGGSGTSRIVECRH